jgi:hypothetical protein
VTALRVRADGKKMALAKAKMAVSGRKTAEKAKKLESCQKLA